MKQKGFTLLEILLVLVLIGILATLILVAINPNRQLAQARDAARLADLTSLSKALDQYAVDNQGAYPSAVQANSNQICNTGSETIGGATNCSGLVDLRLLVPDYMSTIPRDSLSSGTGTGYAVGLPTANQAISLQSLLAETRTIALNPILWSPVNLGANLGLWLDAEDSSTITLNGSNVSQWRDKSGNNRHASESIPGNQPSYSLAGLNEKAVLTFGGVDDRLNFASSVVSAQPFTAFVVYTSLKTASPPLGAPSGGTGIARRGTGEYIIFAGTSLAGGSHPTTVQIGSALYNGASSVGRWNGGSFVLNGNAGTGANITRLGVNNTDFHQGLVAEVIVATGNQSAQFNRVEGYLAHKWGLTANLPTNHPHRISPPYQ